MDLELAGIDWSGAIAETWNQLVVQLAAYAPRILAALVLFALGVAIAFVLARLTRTLLRGTDMLMRRSTSVFGGRGLSLSRRHVDWIGRAVFWLTILFFLAVSANALGLEIFAVWVAGFFTYLPNLLIGALIIAGGWLLSAAVRAMTYSAARSAGLSEAELLARGAQAVTLLAAFVVGIEQLGIQLQFVTQLVLVGTGVLLFGVALAFGLGASALVANIVGAQQLHNFVRLGERLELDGVEGVVIELTAAGLVLETDAGRAWIPARLFLERPCTSVAAADTED